MIVFAGQQGILSGMQGRITTVSGIMNADLGTGDKEQIITEVSKGIPGWFNQNADLMQDPIFARMSDQMFALKDVRM